MIRLILQQGLAQSQATPVNSSSAGDTLATLLPDSTNEFAPLTSSIERDSGASTTTTSEAHVKTIASDGDNGFHVIFVVAGEERSVHFEEDDYDSASYGYYKEVDGCRILVRVPHRLLSRYGEEPGYAPIQICRLELELH